MPRMNRTSIEDILLEQDLIDEPDYSFDYEEDEDNPIEEDEEDFIS